MGNKIHKASDVTREYDLKEILGTGSFATVKRAIKKSDKKEYAIKIIKKSKLKPEELAVVHDEVEIMHKVAHPNCAKLYDMFENKKKVFMVLELLSGGELFDRIVAKLSYSEKEASDLIRSIADAIKYLHSIGVVHRDLKPENLIYESEQTEMIKITDFGLAKFAKNVKMETACGTPGYVAPEVLKGDAYGPPVDLWSLGVILFILLCGFPPFFHDCTTALYRQIRKGQYEFSDPYWTDISAEAKDLVSKLLTVDPKLRYTPQQVLDHPWISGGKASVAKFGDSYGSRMELMLARRTLRRGVKTIIALNKFKRALVSL